MLKLRPTATAKKYLISFYLHILGFFFSLVEKLEFFENFKIKSVLFFILKFAVVAKISLVFLGQYRVF